MRNYFSWSPIPIIKFYKINQNSGGRSGAPAELDRFVQLDGVLELAAVFDTAGFHGTGDNGAEVVSSDSLVVLNSHFHFLLAFRWFYYGGTTGNGNGIL